MASDRLKTELETYERRKNELVEKGEGRFVVIRGTEVLGTWGAYEDALKDGYEKCGLHTPFLVKQISSVEQVHVITRELCCDESKRSVQRNDSLKPVRNRMKSYGQE